MSISRIIVLPPAPLQCYSARQLRTVPHYQIDPGSLPQLEAMVQRHNSRSPQSIELDVLTGAGNDFIVAVGRLPRRINLLELAQPLAAAGLLKHKKGRNQCSVDLGTTGHNNSVRSRATYGLPRPNKFSGTDTDEARRLFRAMGDCLLDVFPGHHRRLMDHAERNRLFSFTHCPGSPIEALTLSLNEVDPRNCLAPHVDSNNDDSSEEHRKVVVFSDLFWDPSSGKLARVAVVLYWKQAASDFLERSRRLFRPARMVLRYVEEIMGPEERDVGPHLLPAPGADHVALGDTHSCKFVTYSVPAEGIRTACSICPALLTGEHLASMVYVAASTNLPRVFAEELLFAVKNQAMVFGQDLGSLAWQDFAFSLYQRVRQVSSGGVASRGYVALPRHRPCHATASRDVFLSSVDAVLDMMANLVEVTRRDPGDCRFNPSYYFDRAIASLSRRPESGGAHGVGPFSAQFLVGIAGLLLPIDGAICSCATVGYDTLTGVWLRRLGLRDGGKEFHEDQAAVVSMVSSCLDVPQTVAEEMVCKAGKQDRGTCGMFKDLIPACVRRVNYRLVDGTLMALLPDGTRHKQEPLRLMLCPRRASRCYWQVESSCGRLSARRVRARAGMIRTLGSQLPLLRGAPREQVEVLTPEGVVLSSTRPDCPPFDAGRIARMCGGSEFETVLVDHNGRVLSLEARLKHQEQAKSGLVGPGKRKRGSGKSRKMGPSMERWHSAAITVDGMRVNPPPGFALGKDGPGKSLVHNGTRFFQNKDDALDFAVLHACLTMPQSFSHLEAVADLLLSMPCQLSCEDDHWDGQEDPVVCHRVISRLTTYSHSGKHIVKSKLPHLVALRFRSGARGVYLVTPEGKPCSDLHVSFAWEFMRKSFSETVECVGIVSHRKQGGVVHVLLAWADSSRSWVPLEEAAGGAPWAVALYAWNNGLVRKSHWRSAKKARNRAALFPASVAAFSQEDVSNKTALQMTKFRHRKMLLAAGADPGTVDQVIHQRIPKTVSPRCRPFG